ncbi:hypothetical protein QYF36_001669 [Acer negundo]|nr:hypothetical protein QYF36_001669 [Acer negundo]
MAKMFYGSTVTRSKDTPFKKSNARATMHKKHTVQSILIGKDKFMVTVYPNIDYAFIIALIVILDAINKENSGSGSECGVTTQCLFYGFHVLLLLVSDFTECGILTAQERWEVFRGDSTDSDDMIFYAKKSLLIQRKTELDVYLANNVNEYVSDFKVKGSWSEQSCTVYAGESNAMENVTVKETHYGL